MVSKKGIHHEREGGIENKIRPSQSRLSSLGKPCYANRDPRDGFFYPTLTLMRDTYNLQGSVTT